MERVEDDVVGWIHTVDLLSEAYAQLLFLRVYEFTSGLQVFTYPSDIRVQGVIQGYLYTSTYKINYLYPPQILIILLKLQQNTYNST